MGSLTRRELFLALAGGAAANACGRTPRSTGQSGVGAGLPPSELILCGWDEVFIVRGAGQNGAEPETVWSWRATDDAGVPVHLRTKFRTTDECKPVEGGRRILITASSDGVALVGRETGRAVFYASVTNAHSAEQLPGGRIVVAGSSGGSRSAGDRLVLFDIATPEKELFSDSLLSAHGVVWDDRRAMLWALGYGDLRACRLRAWETASPVLEPAHSFPLPDPGGHDLSPIPGGRYLFVSTGEHCWLFDRERARFEPHFALAGAARVKSCSVDPATGRIAYVQAEGENWWAERVHFLRPEGVLEIPGRRLYKARWNTPV
jgi:hypothetical protein